MDEQIEARLERIGTYQAGTLMTETGEVWHPANLLLPAANEIARLRAEVAELTRDRNGWGDTAAEYKSKIADLERQLETASRKLAQAILTLGDFKNFHRNLCNRFGYNHEELNWQRDLASLEEHIAGQLAEARRETWKKAARIIEAHMNHENFYHGMVETCLEETAKEIRAAANGEREP